MCVLFTFRSVFFKRPSCGGGSVAQSCPTLCVFFFFKKLLLSFELLWHSAKMCDGLNALCRVRESPCNSWHPLPSPTPLGTLRTPVQNVWLRGSISGILAELPRAETNSAFWHEGALKLESVDELRNPWNRTTHFCVCVSEHFSGKGMQSFYWLSKWPLTSSRRAHSAEAEEASVPPASGVRWWWGGGFLCLQSAGERVPLWVLVVFFVSVSPRCPSAGAGPWKQQTVPELPDSLCFSVYACIWANRSTSLSFQS